MEDRFQGFKVRFLAEAREKDYSVSADDTPSAMITAHILNAVSVRGMEMIEKYHKDVVLPMAEELAKKS